MSVRRVSLHDKTMMENSHAKTNYSFMMLMVRRVARDHESLQRLLIWLLWSSRKMSAEFLCGLPRLLSSNQI